MRKLKTLTALRRVRELLADPAHWTKGCDAKDKDGCQVYPTDAKAVQWCLRGACLHVEQTLSRENSVALSAIENRLDLAAYFFNDSSSHQDVLALLDLLIGKYQAAVEQRKAGQP